MLWLILSALLALASATTAINFPWEAAQLSLNETTNYPDIAFGDASGVNATYRGPKCKVGPWDDAVWPAVDEWAKFNRTLGGVLLKPVPPGAACYPGSPHYDAAKCSFLLSSAFGTRFYSDDPVTVLTEWPEGNTCTATWAPTGTCTQGGYPVYVVNATKVRHIQLAVNFARNRNLRLVIKNTGHDFGGRSTGAGALSIWTHYLKDFEFIPEHSIDGYEGRVARVSAGIEAWELYNYMDKYNMTMVVPGGDTVGAFGGWIAGGGHNSLSSSYGHGADQILAFQVVTADGKYRAVTPHQNADLFFAMLGGGGSTYGVLTSAIVKAYPPTPITNLPLSFQVGSASGFGVNSTEIFWEGVRVYQYFAPVVTDAGGTMYSYVSKSGPGSYSFRTTFEMPNMTPQQVQALVQPLYTKLNKLGIPVKNSLVSAETTTSFAPAARTGAGAAPGNNYFGSRLFPRACWDNETIYNPMFAAIRATVEAGYTFHGINHAVDYKKAGYPGNMNAISPTWRNALMHADIFDYSLAGGSIGGRGGPGAASSSFKAGHAELEKYMDMIRASTPTGGAYFNEGDVLEPNWQTTFFGANYPRLLKIKRARDPWGLFWAPTMPGSEAWVVVNPESEGGLPTQNGPLCQTGWDNNSLKHVVKRERARVVRRHL
ncbi:FAD binding domain-containing protein [Apodospora peruviana]|uniref:FAD binding domain-containing protein n=1 Tax=Apodospora peruviana TaxID=516989 RepID=A0AAE0HTB4_9PEZI|nr:FAD binding domain-containing protein [Apodospora peruviana]